MYYYLERQLCNGPILISFKLFWAHGMMAVDKICFFSVYICIKDIFVQLLQIKYIYIYI